MIIGGRRACGKSTELVKISHFNNIPIIVLDNRRAEALKYIAKKENCEIPNPITIDNFHKKIIGKDINEILIDDIEDILSKIFFPSRIITMSTSIAFSPLCDSNTKLILNEEEIIKHVNLSLVLNKNTPVVGKSQIIMNVKIVQGLLDLYKREKEKNIELINAKIGVDLSGEEYVSKDRIREKIKEIERRLRNEYDLYEQAEDNIDEQYSIHRRINMLNYVEDELKELLKED